MRSLVLALYCMLLLPLLAQETAKDEVRLKTNETFAGDILFRNEQVIVLQTENGERLQFPTADVLSVKQAGGTSNVQITLKTGESYCGKIQAENEQIVMLETATGERIQIRKTEIAGTEPCASAVGDTTPPNNADETAGTTDGNKFNMMLDLSGGGSFARNSYGWAPALQGTLTFGVRDVLLPNTFMGVGTGYAMCFAGKSPEEFIGLIPVFARLQGTIGQRTTAPYVELDAGYGFSLRSDIKGGMMLKLSLGVTHRFSSRTAVYAGIYGSLQNLSGDGMREINAWGNVYTYNGHTTTQQAGVKVALRF